MILYVMDYEVVVIGKPRASGDDPGWGKDPLAAVM